MNALHIILNSARLLDDSELATSETLLAVEDRYSPFNATVIEGSESGTSSEQASELETIYTSYPRLKTYLSALNFVVSELAESYYRIPASVKAVTTDNKVFIRKLNGFAGIISVTDGFGNSVDYSMAEDNAIVFEKNGVYTINYYQIPVVKDIYSKLGYFADRVDFNLLAYGVCASYCLMTGRYAEFNEFDKIYRTRLPKRVGCKMVTLPYKRWV